MSGLFVGFVLGFPGLLRTLQRYGSSEALGLLVPEPGARTGAGDYRFAVCRAGRHVSDAEIGLMKAGEQLSAMEMMAVDPCAASWRRAFGRWRWHCQLLAAVFSAGGVIGGWVVGVLMIGVDAGSVLSQMQGGWMCGKTWATASSKAWCLV